MFIICTIGIIIVCLMMMIIIIINIDSNIDIIIIARPK